MPAAPPMRRAKSGDALRTSERRARGQALNQSTGDSPATKVARNLQQHNGSDIPSALRRSGGAGGGSRGGRVVFHSKGEVAK